MTYSALLTWVNDPLRTAGELSDACMHLALATTGTIPQLRNRLRMHIAAQPQLAPSPWSPTIVTPTTPATTPTPATPPTTAVIPWYRRPVMKRFFLIGGTILVLAIVFVALFAIASGNDDNNSDDGKTIAQIRAEVFDDKTDNVPDNVDEAEAQDKINEAFDDLEAEANELSPLDRDDFEKAADKVLKRLKDIANSIDNAIERLNPDADEDEARTQIRDAYNLLNDNVSKDKLESVANNVVDEINKTQFATNVETATDTALTNLDDAITGDARTNVMDDIKAALNKFDPRTTFSKLEDEADKVVEKANKLARTATPTPTTTPTATSTPTPTSTPEAENTPTLPTTGNVPDGYTVAELGLSNAAPVTAMGGMQVGWTGNGFANLPAGACVDYDPRNGVISGDHDVVFSNDVTARSFMSDEGTIRGMIFTIYWTPCSGHELTNATATPTPDGQPTPTGNTGGCTLDALLANSDIVATLQDNEALSDQDNWKSVDNGGYQYNGPKVSFNVPAGFTVDAPDGRHTHGDDSHVEASVFTIYCTG